MNQTRGQTLTEYALALGLVAVVSITAMITMGDWTSVTFENMITRKPVANTIGFPPTTTPSILPVAGPGTPPLINPTGPGTMYSFANYPGDLATLVETTGMDGALKQYADFWDQLAQQMKADGLEEESYQRLLTFAALIRNGDPAKDQQELSRLNNLLKQNDEKCSATTIPSTANSSPEQDITGGISCMSSTQRADIEAQIAALLAKQGIYGADTQDKLLAFIEDPQNSNLPFNNSNSFQYQISQLLVQMNKDGTLKNPDIKKLIGDTVLKTATLSGQAGMQIKSGQSENATRLTEKVVQDLKNTNMKQIVNCVSSAGGLQSGNVCLN